MAYPEPLERLITAFERFPGVGRRTAERLAFHVLRDKRSRELAPAIEHAAKETVRCGQCSNVADRDPCRICADEERDGSRLLVVEEPRDVEAMERAGCFDGRYHVLFGAWNPADGTEGHHLSVGRLVERAMMGQGPQAAEGSRQAEGAPADGAGVTEVILGTDPDAEGEATALYVLEALDSAGFGGRVTRLARGLPAGSALEYLHRGVLEDALEGRIALRGG